MMQSANPIVVSKHSFYERARRIHTMHGKVMMIGWGQPENKRKMAYKKISILKVLEEKSLIR